MDKGRNFQMDVAWEDWCDPLHRERYWMVFKASAEHHFERYGVMSETIVFDSVEYPEERRVVLVANGDIRPEGPPTIVAPSVMSWVADPCPVCQSEVMGWHGELTFGPVREGFSRGVELEPCGHTVGGGEAVALPVNWRGGNTYDPLPPHRLRWQQ